MKVCTVSYGHKPWHSMVFMQVLILAICTFLSGWVLPTQSFKVLVHVTILDKVQHSCHECLILPGILPQGLLNMLKARNIFNFFSSRRIFWQPPDTLLNFGDIQQWQFIVLIYYYNLFIALSFQYKHSIVDPFECLEIVHFFSSIHLLSSGSSRDSLNEWRLRSKLLSIQWPNLPINHGVTAPDTR